MASIKLQGDNSGTLTIEAPSDAGNNTITLPATTQTLATQNALGVRNLIINGDMRIAQRGTSVSGITSSAYHTIDRYYTVYTTGGTWTQSQDTDAPNGFSSSLKMSCTTANASLSANSRLYITTRLEGQNLQHLKFGTSSAEKITLSFWVKSNKTGTYTISYYNADNAKANGKTYTINTADTWEKKTITIDGDTASGFDNDNNYSLAVYFWMLAGTDWTSGTFDNGTWNSYVQANFCSSSQVNLADSTSNYINITGVQLEVGDTATPFEHRPWDMELARCQRYYEKSYDYGDAPGSNVGATGMTFGHYGGPSGANYRYSESFRVTKRIGPTMLGWDAVGNANKMSAFNTGNARTDNYGTGSRLVGASSTYNFHIREANLATDERSFGTHWTADAEL